MRIIAACGVLMASVCAPSAASAAELSIEFAGGGSEVTLARGETVRIDVIWTMQASDSPQASKLHGVNLRFNVNDVPDPDGSDRNDQFIVESVTTDMPLWSLEVTTGIGSFFSEFNFFLSDGHPDGAMGIEGSHAEFSTVIGSFILKRVGYAGGESYITLRHLTAQDPLPDATNNVNVWDLRWQDVVDAPMQYALGLGNPGDGGPQWTVHGLESFEPLIIHSDPAESPPADDDDDEAAPDGDDDASTDDEAPEQGGGGHAPDADDSASDPRNGPGQPSMPPPAYEPPDRDADGVPKALDRCPATLRGRPVDANGCAIDDPLRPINDADRDGVADRDDDCPRTRLDQSANERGCGYDQRDDDGDGVRNAADLCDDSAPGEKVGGRGCPTSRTDADADSVPDAFDLCPDSPPGQAVDPAGCVAEQAAALLQSPAPSARLGGLSNTGCGAVGLVPLFGLSLGWMLMLWRAER